MVFTSSMSVATSRERAGGGRARGAFCADTLRTIRDQILERPGHRAGEAVRDEHRAAERQRDQASVSA